MAEHHITPVSTGRTDVVSEGARGKPGGLFYEHVQSAPAAEWIVNHNLGFRPIVMVVGPGGDEVDAAIAHQSINQVRVVFTLPLSGRVRCL